MGGFVAMPQKNHFSSPKNFWTIERLYVCLYLKTLSVYIQYRIIYLSTYMCKENMHKSMFCVLNFLSWITSGSQYSSKAFSTHTQVWIRPNARFSAHCITAVTFTRSLRLWRSSLLGYICQIFHISCVTTATNTHSCSARQYVRVQNRHKTVPQQHSHVFIIQHCTSVS